MQEASERLGQLTRPEDPAQAGTHTGGTAPDAGERQEDFEELIRGRYKADFDARVKKILDGRLRGLRQEVTDLRQREKLRQLQIQYYLDRLPEQEKQVRMVHPEFRLQKEMENPRFFRLVQAGVEPREAYEMVHRRELTAKAMTSISCGWSAARPIPARTRPTDTGRRRAGARLRGMKGAICCEENRFAASGQKERGEFPDRVR